MPARPFALLFTAGLLALPLPLSAQDEGQEGAEAPAPSAPPRESEAADAPPAASEAAGAAESRRAAAEEEDDFVPTEEAPPDEQVVFPVDI